MSTTLGGDVALGILAGGLATRLGGLDKAWLERNGEPQVLRLVRHFAADVVDVYVSANRDESRYAGAGLAVVPDRQPGLGPVGGLDALAAACGTSWLLTVPVDVLHPGDDLLQCLRHGGQGGNGAFAIDDDGPQPLVALWRVAALRDALPAALADGERAVHALQARLHMAPVRMPGVRFGNLNTPADLAAAGITPTR